MPGASGTAPASLRFSRHLIRRAPSTGAAPATEEAAVVRILILEDDPLIALDLTAIVEAQGHEVLGSFPSVAAAAEHLDEPVDFALLDIDVADGKSFGLATALRRRDIPFAFVSGSHRSEIPAYLANVLVIPKPYREAVIVQSLPRDRHAA